MARTNALMFGVLMNMAYLLLFRQPDFPIEASLRPAMTMAGANSRGTTLFAYKNFAAIFLMVGGAVLVCRPLWTGWKGRGSLLVVLVGAAGIAASCCCGSRSVLVLLPLLAVGGWLLWLVMRLYGNKGIGWGTVLVGIIVFLGLVGTVGDLFLGHSTLQKLLEVDTHLRTLVWKHICNILPDVPWYGHGAGASQWQIVPFYTEWQTPNYAHNEYLQAWVDYGVAGHALMLLVLGCHLTLGFWSMASEEVSAGRRALIAACLLILSAMALCALFEFVWHGFAFAALSAFACGVLASPVPGRSESLFSRRRWAPGSTPSLRPVRLMGRGAMACACIACVLLAAASMGLGWRLLPAWGAQWQYNALCHAGASGGERMEFLERAVEFCPDPELAAHYVTLEPPPGRADNLLRMEVVLRRVLESNPHHLFTVVMLADVLGREGKCEEAEMLMREHYQPGGQDGTLLANWPGYYGVNLLRWGCQRMASGDYASALSMIQYALKISRHSFSFADACGIRSEGRRRETGFRKKIPAFVATCRVDMETMRAIGVEPNHAWQQPMRPGGPRALYSRWGNPGTEEKP